MSYARSPRGDCSITVGTKFMYILLISSKILSKMLLLIPIVIITLLVKKGQTITLALFDLSIFLICLKLAYFLVHLQWFHLMPSKEFSFTVRRRFHRPF